MTVDDFLEAHSKWVQRGRGFVWSKLHPSRRARTRSAFDQTAAQAANWWIIPRVRKRWNNLITGSPEQTYEEMLMSAYFKGRQGLRMLSLGSGAATHEWALAAAPALVHIDCVDLSAEMLHSAAARVQQENPQRARKMAFHVKDIADFDFPDEAYDVVLFHSSLHHFRHVDQLLEATIARTLRPKGLLIVNEYVGPNRLQYPTHQLQAVEEALHTIPPAYRTRYMTGLLKTRVRGPGRLRMILADPSECVDSEAIVPTLHRHFDTIYERAYGGNLLMPVLKDIAHHFVSPDADREAVLEKLFDMEDDYLKRHPSDFLFGIYGHRNQHDEAGSSSPMT